MTASPDGWRRRFNDWWQSRLPRSDTLLLTQRNIYILPTRAGLLFALTLVVLLIASINYQLNLGYVLTFLLAGSGAVSMHLTHNTLRGLSLHLRPAAPVFAGDAAALEVVLRDARNAARYGIGLRMADAPRGASSWIDVPAGGQATARVSFTAAHRGYNDVPPLHAETRFPLGLFRAWTVWRPAARVLAFPTPERPAAPLPSAHAVGSGLASAEPTDSGDTEGVRAYRRGDAMKLIVWKKFARAGELVSRDTSAMASRQLWLDFASSGSAGSEERLSRLAAWALVADRQGTEFGLRLPGRELPLAHGELHLRRCLEALALWSSGPSRVSTAAHPAPTSALSPRGVASKAGR